jgi:hypothetical protein
VPSSAKRLTPCFIGIKGQRSATPIFLTSNLAPGTLLLTVDGMSPTTPFSICCESNAEAEFHNRFTRGWTLQELIAPSHVLFLDESWTSSPTGSTKLDLVLQLCEITHIDRQLLEGARPLRSFSIAQRISWAAFRSTMRVEDAAYSLLGLFDLNMPLLYGEEEKAFTRLQEEIIRASPDLSILAWRLDSTHNIGMSLSSPSSQTPQRSSTPGSPQSSQPWKP